MKKHKHKGRSKRPHLNGKDSQLLQQSIAHDLAVGSAEFWEHEWMRFLSGLNLPDDSDGIMVFACQRCDFQMSTFIAAAGHVPLALDCCRESLIGELCKPRTAEQESLPSVMQAEPHVYGPGGALFKLGAPRFIWQRPTLAEYLTLPNPDGVEWVRRGGLLPYPNQPATQPSEKQ